MTGGYSRRIMHQAREAFEKENNMAKIYVGTGTVENGLIRLDDAKGLPAGRVRVTVEEDVPKEGHSIFDIEAPPGPGRSTEEILRELRALRDEWDRDDGVDAE